MAAKVKTEKVEDRWDFTGPISKLICEKSAARCANPNCRKIARLPTAIGDRIINVGEAAHILAAAPNGPRGRLGTKEEITSEKNGLWLCVSCHRLVDRDPGYYAAERLRLWKEIAEKEFDYDPITLAISLPGHYAGDTLDKTPGIPAATALLGLHVLVGPSHGLRAVCSKLTVQILSSFGLAELRSHKYYDDVKPGTASAKSDWHSFMLGEGTSANVYFQNKKVGWLAHNIMERSDSILLLRAKAYSRAGADELEPFLSPWVVAILNPPRLEYDEANAYSHLVRWADVIERLVNSGSAAHQRFAVKIMALQRHHADWPALSLESLGNTLITDTPTLLGVATRMIVVPPLELGGETISGVYSENGYMIQRSYASNPSVNPALDRTDVAEFGNGGGAAGDHHSDPERWKAKWVRGGTLKINMLSDGNTRPATY